MFQEYLNGSVDIFSGIGALATGIISFKIAITIFRFLSTYIFSSHLGLQANLKKAGSWAVVTGCTDGIGKAYAEQLAAKGLNVVLLSRTLSKLTEMAEAIESEYEVQTRVIATDFTRVDIYDEIKNKLAGLDIGVLVNNVGVSYDYPEYFADVDTPDFVNNMIHMNCTSVAKMTEIVLPMMVQKRCGYVINIGSSAGSRRLPLLSLYSATKAYVDVLSHCLHHEYSKKGISVQCVRPYFVVSKLSKYKKPSLFVPTPTAFVKNALSTVGIQASTTGYWAHELQELYMRFLPVFVFTYFMGEARAKALKKKSTANKTQ